MDLVCAACVEVVIKGVIELGVLVSDYGASVLLCYNPHNVIG